MIDLGSLNWIGGMVGAVLAFIFGVFWYSSKGMGDRWLKSMGKTLDDLPDKPLVPMLFSMFYHVLLAFFIIVVYQFTGGGTHGYFMTMFIFIFVGTIGYAMDYLVEEREGVRELFCITSAHEFILTAIIVSSVALV